MTMNELDEKDGRKPYKAPELTVYGRFAELTASGNSGSDECGNRGRKKTCRP